jgi:hypothetical protein
VLSVQQRLSDCIERAVMQLAPSSPLLALQPQETHTEADVAINVQL